MRRSWDKTGPSWLPKAVSANHKGPGCHKGLYTGYNKGSIRVPSGFYKGTVRALQGEQEGSIRVLKRFYVVLL